jgi:hypothetical protein
MLANRRKRTVENIPMPNLENTVQVAARCSGEHYLHTYQLEAAAVPPAARVATSFGMTLQELFEANQKGVLPGQEDLLHSEDAGRLTLRLSIVEADPRILRALERQARFAEATITEYLEETLKSVLCSEEAGSILSAAGDEVCPSLGVGAELLKAQPR